MPYRSHGRNLRIESVTKPSAASHHLIEPAVVIGPKTRQIVSPKLIDDNSHYKLGFGIWRTKRNQCCDDSEEQETNRAEHVASVATRRERPFALQQTPAARFVQPFQQA